MLVKERLYTVDDVLDLSRLPENANKFFYLIDGMLYDMPRPGYLHGELALEIGLQIKLYAKARDLGGVTVESGYHPPDDRQTLLGPDVAFIRKSKVPRKSREGPAPAMPDLAVEIRSPSNTLSQLHFKAEATLRHGTTLVWIVIPADERAEVCRSDEYGRMTIQNITRDGRLSGEDVLPGFELSLRELFADD